MSTPAAHFQTFEGTSTTGDLSEALTNAIAQAEAELSQDFLNWELVKIQGQHGGIVGATKLTVVIRSTGSKQLPTESAQAAPQQAAASVASVSSSSTLTGGLEKFAQTASINPVFLDATAGTVELALTVSTYCHWQFEFLHIDESQPPGGAQRRDTVGDPKVLIGKSATWVLRITNVTEEEQDYYALVLLKQADNPAADAAYEFEEKGKIDPAQDRDAILTRTLTFFAA